MCAHYEAWLAQMHDLEARLRAEYSAWVPDSTSEPSLLDSKGQVPWQSAAYWAARCVPVIKTMTQSFTRPRDGSAKTPEFWQKPTRKGDVDDSDVAESSSSSSSDGFFGLCPDDDDLQDPVSGFKRESGDVCGELPREAEALENLFLCANAFKGTGREAIYCKLPHEHWREKGVGRLSAHNLINSASSSLFDTHSLADISVDQWHADQKAYFAALNKHDQEPDNVSSASESDSDLDPEDDLSPPTKKSPSELQVRLDACRHELRIFLQADGTPKKCCLADCLRRLAQRIVYCS